MKGSEQAGKAEKKNKGEEAEIHVIDEPSAKPNQGLTLLTGEYLKGVDVKTFLSRYKIPNYLNEVI